MPAYVGTYTDILGAYLVNPEVLGCLFKTNLL